MKTFRPLRQTVSYDVPLSAAAATQFRAGSIDHSNDVKRNLTTPPITEEAPTWNPPRISSSSSEHDNQETNNWSSDYSNSEDEYTVLDEGPVPVSFLLKPCNLFYAEDNFFNFNSFA